MKHIELNEPVKVSIPVRNQAYEQALKEACKGQAKYTRKVIDEPGVFYYIYEIECNNSEQLASLLGAAGLNVAFLNGDIELTAKAKKRKGGMA